MLQHPLDSPSSESSLTQESLDLFSNFPPLTDDDLSSFERRISSPLPHSDAIVRAQSPFGRRYMKPINGIQIKGFARSAQRRSSVLTLGSIERLQNFYAKKDLKVDKGGTLGFKQTLEEEPEELEDQLPIPNAPPPSWINLDVVTDLDVLLAQCFESIQSTLSTWAMVTGPRLSSSSSGSSHPLSETSEDQPSQQAEMNGTFQILPLLQSVATMLSSVRNYTVNRHDLSDEAVGKLRHASLDLLASMKELENQHRVVGGEENGEDDEDDGYLYSSSDFDLLEKERQAINSYLNVVEACGFNPPHHLGSPPAMFSPEIQALMGKTSILSLTEAEEMNNNTKQTTKNTVPEWLERGSFVNDPMARYYALLLDNLGSLDVIDIPDPKEDEDAFLQSLADGIAMCNIYNSIVKRSRRPFGFITKIHNDSRRTYRAIENLRFFSAACKFRFELTFDEFDPSEIARKTDKGLAVLKKIVEAFCECVIQELRKSVDLIQKQRAATI